MDGKIDDTRHREGTHPYNNESVPSVVDYEKSALLRSMKRWYSCTNIYLYIYVYVNIWEKSVVRLDKRTSMRTKNFGDTWHRSKAMYRRRLGYADIGKTNREISYFEFGRKAKKIFEVFDSENWLIAWWKKKKRKSPIHGLSVNCSCVVWYRISLYEYYIYKI